jgi:hypothetical protein
MSYLNQEQANRVVTTEELQRIQPIIEENSLAIRCNHGQNYIVGDGFNLDTSSYDTNIKYATALYASVCFAQDTIHHGIDEYFLLLMKDCALSSGETYTYRQGDDIYITLPKCHGLGGEASVVRDWRINDSAITLARNVIERILAL